MSKLHVLIHSLLLVTSPSLLVYPEQPTFAQAHAQEFNGFKLSYDEILQLLQDIEEGKMDSFSEEKLEKVSHFLACLAEKGMLPRDYAANAILENDIAALFDTGEHYCDFTYDYDFFDDSSVVSAVLNGEENAAILLSKHKKKDKHDKKRKDKHSKKDKHHKRNVFARVKHFVTKHKKAILIGAAILVAATAVIVAVVAVSSAGAAVATAAGAAAAIPRKPDEEASVPSEQVLTSMDEHIAAFKESLAQNQFFQPANSSIDQGLSWEENGRTLGALFAHDSFNNFQGSDSGHAHIDRKFSTDYSYLYNTGNATDFNVLSHQVRGEKALSLGYYNQAVQDFGRVIEINPKNPIPYLERGMAHFNLGQYDQSLQDYQHFVSQAPDTFSVIDFSLGFARGVPKGAYESGEGLLLFMSDFVTHPIQTSRQIVDAFGTLANLVQNDALGVIAEALSPEIHQLVTQWDALSSERKGELAGYAVGKLGADIVTPGALATVASRSVKGAKELIGVCQNLRIAQETLILETAAEIGSTAKIAEVIEAGQRTAFYAEELGFAGQEIGQLKQAGQLEAAIASGIDSIVKNPTLKESFELFDKAQEFLKPYKGFMSEAQARELIHQAGIRTFPRPLGVPDSFRVKLSGKGAGMIYVHPKHTHTLVRIMPGKPHSPFPYQQKPYVIQMKDGKFLDKFGNKVLNGDVPEAHIPYEEFFYRD